MLLRSNCPPWEDVGLGDEYAEVCSCGWGGDDDADEDEDDDE